MPQNQRTIPLTLVFLSLSVGSGAALADTTKDIEDALKIGKDGAVKFDTRYRYENVNQDNVINTVTGRPLAAQPKTANANTIRSRLGILSPSFYGVQGFVEYEGTHVLQSDYNNTRGKNTGYSVVADPDWNELNQLWISYTNKDFDTVIKGGRQRIKFDDDRFIGNVGWRQLETTFDAVLVTNKSIKNLTVNVGYIGHVSTFTATNEDIRAPILNLNYNMGTYGNLIGYGYWLGYTQPDTTGRTGQASKSSQTYGIRIINPEKPSKKFMDNYSPLYTAEWSIQQDYINSPVNYTANRYNVMGGLRAYNHYDFMAGMEQLNGHGANKVFQTPLGTNHAFQGWADLFLVTPKDGIRDVYGTVVGRFLENDSLEITGTYHAFSDDTGNINYGREWNFQALQKFGKHYSILAKYAYFDSAGSRFSPIDTDTQKIWVQGNVNF